MSVVQQSNPVPEPVAKWWQDVHDTAVAFERLITPDPTTVPSQSWQSIMDSLHKMTNDLKRVPHTRITSAAHENLLAAVDYLYRCYQELSQSNIEESNYYYNSALLQVTSLHQFLVDNGLTNA